MYSFITRHVFSLPIPNSFPPPLFWSAIVSGQLVYVEYYTLPSVSNA